MQCIQQLPASTWKSLPGAAQPRLVAGPQPHGVTSAAKKSQVLGPHLHSIFISQHAR